MKLKTRLLAGVGSLALVGGIAAVAIPASAAVTPTVVGGCSGTQALASIKDTAGVGITNALPIAPNFDKISVKSLATVGMTCAGLATQDGAITPGSLKTSISGAASCNTALVPAGLPPSGKIGWAGASGKEQGYVRFAASDPAVNFYGDVVSIHGMMTKGFLAGADLDGSVFQNPTVKDKTVGATFESFAAAGVDVNPTDGLIIGASCLAGTSAGTLAFNSGAGGKVAVNAPTAISLTMVGDGVSLLDGTGAVAGKLGACPCVPAQGLIFSAF